jgi:DNA-binding PadR family transcriptional regulator
VLIREVAVTENLTEMLKGVLEGCVLEIIDRGETYGYEITRRLNDLGFADVVEGTVYTILIRLEKGGLVDVKTQSRTVGPPRKIYALTGAGRVELRRFWARWSFVASKLDELRKG